MYPDFKQCNKSGLIFGMSNSAVSGSFVYTKQVAYAVANTPQSQPLFVVEQVRQLTLQSAEFQHLISLAEFFGIPAINLRSSYEDSSHQTS